MAIIQSLSGILLIVTFSFGQAGTVGSIRGKVYDEKSGSALAGANVVVVGTSSGAVTDLEGKFLISRLETGTYSLRVSFVGYTAKVITGVFVRGDETLSLDINLPPEVIEGEEITVTAERVISTEAAALAERKKAVTIGDGITMEQVKRTPDATSSDALRRVTGVSLVDNKFVFIRGITDRYNGTTLDGASVSSSEAGKKSFAFDLIPANLIENANVVKSATPDLPGDFSGGLVQLNTLDIPDRFTGKASLASSYNSNTTSLNILRSEGGGKDWLGIDDGAREFPGDNPNPLVLAQSMKNNWAPRTSRAPYNSSLSASVGDQLTFDEDDASLGQLGFIGSFSYRNTVQRSDRTLNDRDQSRLTIGPRDNYAVLWGGIANLTYKFAGLHKISFKNSYDHTGEDEAAHFQMTDEPSNLFFDITQIRFTQRSLYTGQLVGEHLFPGLGGMQLSWRASVSSSARQAPDWKEATFYRALDDPSQPLTASYSKRQWDHVNDRVYSVGMDFSEPLGEAKIKWGALSEKATTNYYIRGWRVAPDGYPDSLVHLPLRVVYSPQNYGPGKFTFSEFTHGTDSYEGDHTLYAGYLMVDIPFEVLANRFRFTGGARLENFEQNVNTKKVLDAIPFEHNRLKNVDILPSMNLTYSVTETMNLRLAYSHSVNRPEFRERSESVYEDFIKNELVTGDPSLQRSYIHNYDVRFEVFPAIGELIALSYFEKHISGAIEQELFFSGTRTRKPFNSGSAKNSGWEIELRKSFSFVNDYLSGFFVTANYTRVISRVEFINTLGNSTNTYFEVATRPMQGQSPYMINVALTFTEPTLGTSASISYNKAGRRLDTVGFLGSDIYEEPRDIVDIAVNQPIGFGVEAKLTIKNLNGKDKVLTRDGVPYEQLSTGTTYGFQLSVSL